MKSIDPASLAAYNGGIAESGFLGTGEMAIMVVERRNLIAIVIVLGAGAMVQLYAGVEAGLHRDWMKMFFALFACSFTVFVGTMMLVVVRLKDSITQLENRLQMNQKPVPRIIRYLQAIVGAFMLLSITVHMIFSTIAGYRGNPFRFGIHLTACAITVILCTGVGFMLVINSRLARLEQFLAGTRKAEDT